MGDFWYKASKVAHGIGMVAHALSGRPHFYRPHLNPHIGLCNWFYAQRRIPRKPHPLPPLYQAMHNRMLDRIKAHEHNPRAMHHTPHMATPPLHRHGR